MRTALAAYYGMVSFLDHNIGQLLRALEDTGLAADTRVIYTSDHGDNLGNRGFWGKSVMYEEAVAVPLIMAGDGIPQNRMVRTPVSLVDLYPTFLEAWARAPEPRTRPRPGSFAVRAGARGEPPIASVFSEYHAVGATAGIYMVRKGRWKYVHYVGHRPQLFDLESRPAGGDRSRRERRSTRRSAPSSRRSCARSSIRRRSTRRRSPIRSARSPSTAAPRRSGSGATSATRRRPVRHRCSARLRRD